MRINSMQIVLLWFRAVEMDCCNEIKHERRVGVFTFLRQFYDLLLIVFFRKATFSINISTFTQIKLGPK
jgi:hypothetical protein